MLLGESDETVGEFPRESRIVSGVGPPQGSQSSTGRWYWRWESIRLFGVKR